MAMNLKKAAIGLMAGLVSAALLAGCGLGAGLGRSNLFHTDQRLQNTSDVGEIGLVFKRNH